MIVVTDRSSQLVTAQCNLAGVAQVKNTRHDRDVRHAREREIEREREREREREIRRCVHPCLTILFTLIRDY